MSSEEFEESYVIELAKLIGMPSLKAFSEDGDLEEIEKMTGEAWAIKDELGIDGARDQKAHELIERLIPAVVDAKLWRAVAIGKNVTLPATDQYGPIAERTKPRDPKVRKPPKGNVYGRVHTKGGMAPSEFMKRQGPAITAAAAKIIDLERELEAAREHKAELEAGMKLYATTCLLTAMRKATASVFAMGPAWTLLRAISGSTGQEVARDDQDVETHRILVVLHALRYHEPFEQELKRAIHAVCVRYGGEAKRRGKPGEEFDGPYDYEEIMKGLDWPDYPPEPEPWRT